MSHILTVAIGTVAMLDGRPVIVKRFVSADTVHVRYLDVIEEREAPIQDLRSQGGESLDVLTRDTTYISDDHWEIAIRRYMAIQELAGKSDRTRDDVEAVARRMNVTYVTVYRWIKRFEEAGLVSALVRKPRSDAGKFRLPDQSEKLLNRVIIDQLLTKRRKHPSKAHEKLRLLCRKEGIPTPNLSTLRRRYYAIVPEVREAKRRGASAVRKYKPIRGTVPGADYPYAVIQIDHTLCDLHLVDSVHRLPVGRPWITLAIDVFSRMIVGYYVSFDPPGMLGTGICIANAILSKDAFLARLGLNYEWPCQGLPTIIHVDNAREFRGNTLKKSCEDYGIDLQFRKIKHPQYGGHIERMLGTLLMEMHEVPGTTFSNPMEKGEFDSAADAALTLDDFERWLANLVVGAYHNRVHSSLGMPPLVKFKQGILGSDDMPGTGVLQVATEPERLRINFLPMDTRTVQPSGIVVDKIAYYSDVLRHWIGALEPGSLRTKRKFLIRRDPRDISFIYFYDPDLEQYFRIPYRNATHPAISLWELRTIQRFLNEQGKKDEDEDAIFQALEEMVRIENAAVKATRKVRMADERRRRHKSHDATSVVVNDSFGQEEVDTQLGDDSEVLPFDDIRPM